MTGEEKHIALEILSQARDQAGTACEHIWLYLDRDHGIDSDGQTVVPPRVGEDEDQGLPGRVARTGVPVTCQDVLEDEFFSPFYRAIFPETRSQWCLPLLTEDCGTEDSKRPVLCLESSNPIDGALRPALDLICALGGIQLMVAQGFSFLRRAKELDEVATQEFSNDAQAQLETWRLNRRIDTLAGIHPETAIRKLFNALILAYGQEDLGGLAFWQHRPDIDYFCRPIYSTASAKQYSKRTRPRRLGLLADLLDGELDATFSSDAQNDPRLAKSRFIKDLNVKAAAFVPVFNPGAKETQGEQALRGILFANFNREFDFRSTDRRVFQDVANVALSAMRLRSRARRYRLKSRFDAQNHPYPKAHSDPAKAIQSVLQGLVDQSDRLTAAAIFTHDQRSGLLVRHSTTSGGEDLVPRFPSGSLFGRVNERRETPLPLNPEEERRFGLADSPLNGRFFLLPLHLENHLQGCCLLVGEGDATTSLSREEIRRFSLSAASLLELEQRADRLTQISELLGRFLSIYEYVAKESTVVPLLEAFLDALLEGSTADACYAFIYPTGETTLKERVARGAVLRPEERPTSTKLETYLEVDDLQFFVDEDVIPGLSSAPIRAQAIIPLIDRRDSAGPHHGRLGMLYVEFHAEHAFTVEDDWIFSILAHQMSQSLRHFDKMRMRFEEVSSLALNQTEISRFGSQRFMGDVPVETESSKLALQAKRLSRADFVDLYLVQDGELKKLAVEGATHPEAIYETWPTDKGLVGWVVQHREPLLVPDVEDPKFQAMGYEINEAFPETRSELIVPIRDGKDVIAVLNLEARRPGAFSETDRHFAEAIAAQAVALRRAAELQQARRQLRRERNLLVQINKIAQDVASEGQTPVLERILEALYQEIDVEFLSIHLLADDKFGFDPRLSVCQPYRPGLLKGLNLDNSIVGWALQEMRDNHEPDKFIPDISNPEPGAQPAEKQYRKQIGKVAELVVAIRQKAEVKGVINIEDPDPRKLQLHRGLIRAVVNGIANALGNAAYMETIQRGAIREQLAKAADEHLKLLTSTVFHDIGPLVVSIGEKVESVGKAFGQHENTLPREMSHALQDAGKLVIPALDRLKRLSKALPRHNVPDRIDLVALVRKTFATGAQIALPHFDPDRFDVEVEIPDFDEPLYIRESANWVTHILENLAGNSFRSMKQKTTSARLQLTVTVFQSRNGEMVGVRVEDQGKGIPPEIERQIGDKKIERKARGSNEQLGIFHKLANEHVQSFKGELELIRNELGKGCTFELRYPNLQKPEGRESTQLGAPP